MTEPALLITPTARLARRYARGFAEAQAAAGMLAWLPQRVLSFPAWLAALRQDYFLASDDPRVPITAPQSRLLWQSLIDMEVFIGEPQVAELAEAAWRRIHEFDLDRPEDWRPLDLSEDSRRFREWALRYRRACSERQLVDEWAFAAEVPNLIAHGLVDLPGTVTLAGFDLPLTPLQARILAALESAGSILERPSTGAAPLAPQLPERIIQTPEPTDELLAAARWARARLEANPAQQIAVVVPDLAGRLDDVERLFRTVFDPPALRLMETGPAPWHISLGAPLRRWPLVADALTLLQLDEGRITQPEAGRLLRSPFLAGSGSERRQRDDALAAMTREAPWEITPLELQHLAEQAGARSFAERLGAWRERRSGNQGSAWPSIWAARFQEELSAFGFGAGRALDSREYQVLQRWHDLLEEFSALDMVSERPAPRGRALALLRDRAAGIVFREQNPGVPVEILGVEEALGSRFDAIWLTTLDSDHWPAAPRRDPLIPARLQAAIPGATADGALDQARQTLAVLLAAAPVVVASFSRGSAEEERQPTALLGSLAVQSEPAAPPEPPAPFAPRLDDWQAPPLQDTETSGGTALLSQQSACPFRAFVERRLSAGELTPPRPGLDAAQRGIIIHRALEQFWSGLPGRAALVALSPEARAERVLRSVDSAIAAFVGQFRLILTPFGLELERRRTARVVERWLEQERERSDFTVAAQERPITLTFAGLTLGGKLDRVDRLADGSLLLIDYKTGANSRNGWYPEARMADPQLPAYAVALDPSPGAIAFARIRPEDLKFEGLARDDKGTEGIHPLSTTGHRFKDLDDWDALLDRWRTVLDGLARDFRAGQAAVDPRSPNVCTRCHLHAVCRIRERAPYAAGDGDGAGDPTDD